MGQLMHALHHQAPVPEQGLQDTHRDWGMLGLTLACWACISAQKEDSKCSVYLTISLTLVSCMLCSQCPQGQSYVAVIRVSMVHAKPPKLHLRDF